MGMIASIAARPPSTLSFLKIGITLEGSGGVLVVLGAGTGPVESNKTRSAFIDRGPLVKKSPRCVRAGLLAVRPADKIQLLAGHRLLGLTGVGMER